MIGPYFFKNDNGTTVTVNSKRYGHMIDIFLSAIEEYDLENMWFQQDGDTCQQFDRMWRYWPHNSRRGDINWPPRSCDLTPLDSWGYAKNRVYADKLSALEHLKTNIR